MIIKEVKKMNNEVKLPMGNSIKCHLGCFELPSEILEIGIFAEFIQCECVDGIYHVNKYPNGSINIHKIKCKATLHEEK